MSGTGNATADANCPDDGSWACWDGTEASALGNADQRVQNTFVGASPGADVGGDPGEDLFLAVSVTGNASGLTAVSGTGDAHCVSFVLALPCAGVSGTGNSSGLIAASGTGNADGSFLALDDNGANCFGVPCVAAEPQEDAHGHLLGVSGTGNSSGGIAGSGTGDSSGVVAVSGTGDSSGWTAASATGSANGSAIAADADGFTCFGMPCVAVDPGDDAHGYLLGVSGTGDSSGTYLAASGTGGASSSGLSASGAGDASGHLVAASGMGNASEGFVNVAPFGDATCGGYGFCPASASGTGDAQACEAGFVFCHALSVTGNASGSRAITGTGYASTCERFICIAASGTQPATGAFAVSGTNDSGGHTALVDWFEDGSIDQTDWTVQGGEERNVTCSSHSWTDGQLVFNRTEGSERSATTRSLDLRLVEDVKFYLEPPCREQEAGETEPRVALQYSTDGGATWDPVQTYSVQGEWPFPGYVEEDVPPEARTSDVRFRWIQLNLGETRAPWTLDHVEIRTDSQAAASGTGDAEAWRAAVSGTGNASGEVAVSGAGNATCTSLCIDTRDGVHGPTVDALRSMVQDHLETLTTLANETANDIVDAATDLLAQVDPNPPTDPATLGHLTVDYAEATYRSAVNIVTAGTEAEGGFTDAWETMTRSLAADAVGPLGGTAWDLGYGVGVDGFAMVLFYGFYSEDTAFYNTWTNPARYTLQNASAYAGGQGGMQVLGIPIFDGVPHPCQVDDGACVTDDDAFTAGHEAVEAAT